MNNDNYAPGLFSDDELNQLEGNLFAKRDAGEPVECLGMTFDSDEARREYFREELRKKLPELRHIEGFPIGEDDDIIALSDPPYYTACPNPWLNDFIAQWEEEKKDLEAQGLRKADFEVMEPYAADVSEGKQNPIYNAHTYHTKVPHPAIMHYILHYTQPGDIIFDGFCGTGMTGVATNLCNSDSEIKAISIGDKSKGIRHSICSDLSPMASFIASNYSNSVDVHSFVAKAEKVLKDVQDECSWMYKTKHQDNIYGEIIYVVWSDVFTCSSCGEEFSFYDSSVDKKTGKVGREMICPKCRAKHIKRNLSRVLDTYYDSDLSSTKTIAKTVPVLIKYRVGKKTFIKEPDKEDLEKIDKINGSVIPYWIPKQELQKGYNTNQPIKSNGITNIHQFYTKRNLYILSSILDKCDEDNLLRLLFSSQLMNLSKLNRYRPEVSFPYNPLNGTLYIASQVCEANVFDAYKNKIDKFSKAFSLLEKSHNVVCVQSALKLLIDQNSVDYIFVDPPFGSNIMYSDLNSIWEGWLKIKTDATDEAIVNPEQDKTLFEYQSLMTGSLHEFYRILKPGKWMTVEFSNTSASVWNSINNAIQSVGFVIANVAALDKQQGSFKAVTTTTAVKQDLIISCFKPSEKLLRHFEEKQGEAMDIYVSTQQFVEELLQHLPVTIVNEKKTTAVVERSPKILYDRLIAFFVQRGQQIPMDAADFQRYLREAFVERDGMFFTAEQAIRYDDMRRENPEMQTLALFVGSEADGIQWLKRTLQDGPQTYQQLQPRWMQDLVAPRKGDTIPELMQILEENFLKNADEQWYIPDAENEADLEKLRNRRLLREFKTYAEAANKPKGRIKEARLEALRVGFKQCYQDKDFATIVRVGDRIPQTLLTEDEILLQYYDIASNRV